MFSFLRRREPPPPPDLVQLAHKLSPYREKSIEWFRHHLNLLKDQTNSEIDFDESFYLSAHDHVRIAVENGTFPCGYVHFCIHGKSDARLWSTNDVARKFGVKPNYPKGLVAPIFYRSIGKYTPDLSTLTDATQRTLFIFIPRLTDQLFFAGYTSFFNDISTILDQFEKIIIAVTEPEYNASLATRLNSKIQVIPLASIAEIKELPNLIYCFDAETFHQAKDIFNRLERTVYYCQDFEAGFFPFGTQFIRCEAAVAQSLNLVLSTTLLEKFMAKQGLLRAKNLFVTAPNIQPISVSPQKHRKLFFYFRPERFNTRNMPEIIMESLELFCARHQGYEIFLVGSVDTTYSFNLSGTPVCVLSKLPKDAYQELLSKCDVVIALIYSAHPGVIAFQAAASGIPTVTNTFSNRDAACLRAISTNILPYDPVTENLLDKIEAALTLPKGQPSFNKERYAGTGTLSFAEFNEMILTKSTQVFQE